MHYTTDYSQSPAPQFDAVEDCKQWLGDKWELIVTTLTPIKHCGEFALACSFAGIQGFPVKALYEHINGQGTWRKTNDQ